MGKSPLDRKSIFSGEKDHNIVQFDEADMFNGGNPYMVNSPQSISGPVLHPFIM